MATHLRTEMHYHSQAVAGKILPQSQKEKAFTVQLGSPSVLPKRSLRMMVLNKGDDNLIFTPQFAASEDGPWTDGTPTTIVAKAEVPVKFAVPAGSDYWRIKGAGETYGVVEVYEVDPSHANSPGLS